MDEDELNFIIRSIEDEGFILNSSSKNEWIYQKENIQLTLNKLDWGFKHERNNNKLFYIW